MSEIIASIYRYMEDSGHKTGILFIDEINCVSRPSPQSCSSSSE